MRLIFDISSMFELMIIGCLSCHLIECIINFLAGLECYDKERITNMRDGSGDDEYYYIYTDVNHQLTNIHIM